MRLQYCCWVGQSAVLVLNGSACSIAVDMLPGRLPCPVKYQWGLNYIAFDKATPSRQDHHASINASWSYLLGAPLSQATYVSPAIAISHCKYSDSVCLQVNIGTVKPFWDVTLKILKALADKKQ